MPNLSHKLSFLLIPFLYASCPARSDSKQEKTDTIVASGQITVEKLSGTKKSVIGEPVEPQQSSVRSIETGNVSPGELVNFAETLIGTPYKYASTDPHVGFDCSGFITYVFNHFNIKVPRSSVDFTHVGIEMPLIVAKRGDIILFTGTDSTIRIVGHMGIITSNKDGQVNFIHSSSGKAKGVIITPLDNYYTDRFVKVINVFDQDRR